MKLSMMSYTMARQGFAVEDIIKTAVGSKLEGIDWVTTYGCNPVELRRMSEDAGLAVACHTFFASRLMAGQADWLDEIRQSIDDAVNLGAPIVMIATGVNDNISRDAFRAFWIEALYQIIKLTEDAGVILTIENYPGEKSAFVTADDFFEAQSQIPKLRLTYDNGNAASGEEPSHSFTRCSDYVVHAHFKDWKIWDTPVEGCRKMLDSRYYTPALIGEGDINHAACLKVMKSAHYSGYINIEYESDKYPADEAVKRAAGYLANLIELA